MKKLLLILIIACMGCTASKYTLSKKEFANSPYSVGESFVYKNGEMVAMITSIEYELYDGKLVKEISLTTKYLSDVEDIIRYVHTVDPRAKIEVNND